MEIPQPKIIETQILCPTKLMNNETFFSSAMQLSTIFIRNYLAIQCFKWCHKSIGILPIFSSYFFYFAQKNSFIFDPEESLWRMSDVGWNYHIEIKISHLIQWEKASKYCEFRIFTYAIDHHQWGQQPPDIIN